MVHWGPGVTVPARALLSCGAEASAAATEAWRAFQRVQDSFRYSYTYLLKDEELIKSNGTVRFCQVIFQRYF